MTHPFEAAGLGKAPFRCVGCFEKWFEMPGFGRKPGGTCAYCGTGILNCYAIKSADGAEFVVGCDCVERTGGEQEVAEFRKERLAWARAKRAAGATMRRAAREAKWQQERQAANAVRAAAFQAAHPVLVEQLAAYAGANKFVLDMIKAMTDWGGLTEGQAMAVARTLAAEKAFEGAKEASQHVGAVGERIKGCMARVTFCKTIAEATWDRPVRRLIKLETKEGAQLVWFTSTYMTPDDEFAECAFTVKEHGEYNGVKQTMVLRVKFKD